MTSKILRGGEGLKEEREWGIIFGGGEGLEGRSSGLLSWQGAPPSAGCSLPRGLDGDLDGPRGDQRKRIQGAGKKDEERRSTQRLIRFLSVTFIAFLFAFFVH